MQPKEIKTNMELTEFLDSFENAEARGDFMRAADNDLIDHFISLSTCVATKMWLSHYKK